MNVSSRLNPPRMAGRDFPKFRGDVRMVLHNCKNHTDDFVFEKHNMATNALADIFAGNYGGLVNYNNFADLFKTWLGGVLVFKNALDLSSVSDYGIPDRINNPCVAHAGQTPFSSQVDDTSRGNPDDTGTVTTVNSTKLVWEWGTSAANDTISALGLTHSDVGSFGCGVTSVAQRSLNPFAEVGCMSNQYSYGNNANTILGINGNTAYTFYLVDNTTVNIYKTPVNSTKFNLQGGSYEPLTDYKQLITATLPNSYALNANHSDAYFYWDFENGKLILFGVPTEGGTTLYKDEIALADGTVTHSSITVTGANLWKFTGQSSSNTTGYGNDPLTQPTKAMIYDGYIYVYGNIGTGNYEKHPKKIYKINLSNTADIAEVDISNMNMSRLDGQGFSRTAERFAMLGGIIVHDSFLINGDKFFDVNAKTPAIEQNQIYALENSISSPSFGIGTSLNMVSVSKMYLATKFNLDSPVTKSASQSMTIEYTLTQT